MRNKVASLVATLTEKKEVLGRMRGLLAEEEDHLAALDLAGMEKSQLALGEVAAHLARLAEECRSGIASLAAALRVPEATTLSPLVERLPAPERSALKRAQDAVQAESAVLNRAVELHRVLLADSITTVNQSVTFFNRLFNPVDTYGNAGSLVSRRGGSRFVCKEI